MPRYSYLCPDDGEFEKQYATLKEAAANEDETECKCGRMAARVLSLTAHTPTKWGDTPRG